VKLYELIQNVIHVCDAVAIVGPTCSGKTTAAIKVAKKINAEIISCDSRQVYKDFNIGSAKPSSEELSQVKHHLIDVADPNVEFNSM